MEAWIQGFAVRRTVLFVSFRKTTGRRQDFGKNMGREHLRVRQQAQTPVNGLSGSGTVPSNQAIPVIQAGPMRD